VASDADAPQLAEAVGALWLEINAALHPIIGQRGVAALYHRSLALTAPARPCLAPLLAPTLPASLDPAALQAVLARLDAAEAAATGCALFDTFRALLASLVGAALTDRLLHAVWAPTTGEPPAQDNAS
jgi:hypothetical protein